MTIEEFGKTIKQKYPQYNDMSDVELGQKMLAKYPQYSDMVTAQAPKKEGFISTFGKAVANQEPQFKASEGGAGTILPNIAKTFGNIPSSAVNLGRTIIAPVNPFDLDNPINIGSNLVKGTQALSDIVKSRGVVQGAKDVAGGFVDTGKGILDAVSTTAKKAWQNPAQAVSDVAKKGIEDPLLVPSLMFGGQRAITGKGDVVSKIARPVTRGADTSIESVARGVGKTVGKAVEPVQARFIPTTEQAIKQLERGYDEIFTATKSGINKLEKSTKSGKDPSRFLAEKGIVPEVSADGKISTELARKQLFDDIEKIDDSLTEGLKSTGKTVKLDDVRAQALRDIDNVQTRADGSLFVRQEEVNKIFDTYKQIYGEQVPLDVLNEIKRGQYRLTKVFDATKPAFAKDVNYKIGNAAKETIEKEATGLNVKGLNQYYGDHLDAIGLLERINGNAVKGGRLGKYFARTTGAIVGGTVGSVGGPVGTALGGVIGDTLVNVVQKKAFQNAITTPATRKAIEKGILRGEIGKDRAFQGFGPFNFK